MATKTDYTGAIIVLFTLIAVIVLATYELFQTPAGDIITSMFLWLFLGGFAFYIAAGEFLGGVLLRKNFQDEGGLTGVWLRKEEHDAGMETHYVATYKRYARHTNYDDYASKGIFETFMSIFARSVIVKYTDKASMFEEVTESLSSTPEGCIKYRGLLRKGVKVHGPIERLREQLRMFEDSLSDLQTSVMTSKSASEAVLQEQTKNISDAAVVISNATNNLYKMMLTKEDKEEKK